MENKENNCSNCKNLNCLSYCERKRQFFDTHMQCKLNAMNCKEYEEVDV